MVGGVRYLLRQLPSAFLLWGAVASALGQPAPSRAPATQPASGPTTRISLNFRDVSVDAMLDQLAEMTGLAVVKDGRVDGRVTLISKQPRDTEEAISIVNSVLKAKGFTAIQTGNVLKIVSVGAAKKANVPVHFGADPAKVAESDEIITQVIPVATLDAVRLRQDLTPLIGGDADVTSNAASNSIVVTDTSANVKRIVRIVHALDQHQSTVSDIKVVQLKYADATAAAKLLMTLFRPDQQQGTNNNPQLPFFLRGPGEGKRSGFPVA
jgi:general secretion pathway protein D